METPKQAKILCAPAAFDTCPRRCEAAIGQALCLPVFLLEPRKKRTVDYTYYVHISISVYTCIHGYGYVCNACVYVSVHASKVRDPVAAADRVE